MTGETVFATAVSLMGEEDDATAASYDLDAFRAASVELINVLIAQLDELDCVLKGVKRTADGHTPGRIEQLSDEIPLHRILGRAVVPFGLCSLLLEEENRNRAALFRNLYEAERTALMRRYNKTRRHSIRNVYGWC